MTKLEFLKIIPTLEKAYIIYSQLTKLPYMTQDVTISSEIIYVYTDEKTAKAQAKYLTEEEKRPSTVVELEKKKLLNLLVEGYSLGVTHVYFHTGKDALLFPIGAIVKEPDFSQVPAESKPLLNPELQLCMIHYFQESRRKLQNADANRLKRLEEDMILYMMHSRFILPLKEVEVDGKKLPQFLGLKTTNDSFLIPIFTDVPEYMHFRGTNEFKTLVMDFKKLAELPLPEKFTGFLLNPSGAAAALEQTFIKKTLETYKEED